MADGLDRAVLRAGEDLKPRPQPPDGLMVCTVDRAARAVQLAQKARRGVDGTEIEFEHGGTESAFETEFEEGGEYDSMC